MIKRILVVLDSDSDTFSATKHAITLAGKYGAEITGMSFVDQASIEKHSRGAAIGAMFLMDKLEARLTQESREAAQSLLADFREAAASSGVSFDMLALEGVPSKLLAKHGMFSDLLVVGHDPHLDYAHPDATPISLGEIIKKISGPVLVTPQGYRDVNSVLVAFDGSDGCVRALRSFLHLKPCGEEAEVHLLNVYQKGSQELSLFLLSKVQQYVRQHGFNTTAIHSVRSTEPSTEILNSVQRLQSNLLVAGAHEVSPLLKLFSTRSTTASLLDRVEVPMWVHS